MKFIDKVSKEKLKEIVDNSYSIADVIEKLGYKKNGRNTITVRDKIIELGIDISHFSKKPSVKRHPENIFVENSDASQRVLREYYLKGNYSEYKCKICNLQPFWENKPLSLRLDHINGINNDNKLTNLRWVCPNCDSQLDTYGSKNQVYQKTLISEESDSGNPSHLKYYCKM